MTPAAALACVCIGLMAAGGICVIVRHERDAWLGRRLRKAAGSDELAELAVRQTRDIRALNEALRMKEEIRKHRANVVRFVPRITSRGRPVRFGPDGAA